MPFKCCVGNCRSNYSVTVSVDGIKKRQSFRGDISLFSFPKYENERFRWIAALPNKINSDTTNLRIGSLHWPLNFPSHKYKFYNVNEPTVYTASGPLDFR